MGQGEVHPKVVMPCTVAVEFMRTAPADYRTDAEYLSRPSRTFQMGK